MYTILIVLSNESSFTKIVIIFNSLGSVSVPSHYEDSNTKRDASNNYLEDIYMSQTSSTVYRDIWLLFFDLDQSPENVSMYSLK